MSQDLDPTRRDARRPPPGVGLDARTEGRTEEIPAGERPQRLGRHLVVGCLGAGGMGEVYAVRDPRLEREVAVKVIRGGATLDAREKFLREALITGQLEHPSIVPLYDMGEDAAPYFVMRKVAGTDLQALLAREDDPPSLAELLTVFVKVCEAVSFAHAKGIIHRDLKPANIMTGAFGEVYVMDWGLAKRLGEPSAASAPGAPFGAARAVDPLATLDGTVMGTPAYMPPEQADGEIARLDARSDVYSLGAILYHLLARVPPYDGESSLAILAQVTAGPPAPPSTCARGGREIPWELEAVCVKAMAHAQDARYPGASALKADVERFLTGRFVGAAHYSPWAALRKWVARHRALVLGAGAVVVAGLAVAGAIEHHARTVERERLARFAERVVEAQDRVRAFDLADLVARARAVPLAADPARRVLPVAAELDRQAEILRALRRASQALGDLLALGPDDLGARKAHYDVLGAFAHLAQARHDDGMAELAYAQAARLGVDDRAALDLARAASDAPGMRLAARAARVEGILDAALEGKLGSDTAYQSALVELASYRERQTVERLVREVDLAAALLRDAAHAAYARALPDEMAGLAPLLAAKLDPRAPVLGAADVARFSEATLRLIRHERRRFGEMSERRAGRGILEASQALAMAEGGRDRAAAVRIACDALGLIGDPEDVVLALERFVWASCDEREAIAAGIALARLAAHSDEARRAVLGVVGLVGSVGKQHTDVQGPFWLAVSPTLAYVGVSATGEVAAGEPDTALQFTQRGLARFYQGDVAGALADYDRAIDLDATSAIARLNRATLLRIRGDHRRALEDLDLAIADSPGLPDAHAQRGATLSALGRRDEAFAAYARAIALDPDHGLSYAARAHTYLAVGDHARALADADRAVAIDPRSITALLARGQVRSTRGELPQAIADFSRALELDSRRVDAYIGRAFASYAAHNEGATAADVGRALALHPGNSPALYLRAVIRRDRKELSLALADAEHAMARDPTDHRPPGLRAQLLCDLGRTTEGLAALGEVIARWPAITRSLVDRANVLLSLRRFDLALADCDRALALDPDDAAALAGRSSAHRLLGDLEAAQVDLDRALTLSPSNAQMWSNRGILNMARRDWTAALAAYDRALELEPGIAKVHCLRGDARRNAKQLDAALADFDRALELDPAESMAHEGRGKVLQARGETGPALASYARALDLDANLPEVHVFRGQLREQQGDMVGAVSDYDRAIELDAGLRTAYLLRGVIRQDGEDFVGASADFARAVELDPQDPLGHANVGAVRWDQGELTQAVAAFDRALALDPDFVLALLNRGDVRALLGLADLARADFDRALTHPGPKRWRAHLGRARLHLAAGRRADAQAAVAQALAEAPPERKAQVDLEGKKILGR